MRSTQSPSARITVQPNSSVISQWSYNPKTSSLTVQFVEGNAFRYRGVPLEVVQKLQRTRGSVGRLFNRLIKENYSGSRCTIR